ncbi:reverse transcriptase domain-containing protein [Streptomyces sp. NPDC087228]
MIPKVNGKLRRLGIPTVADRVVQASLKLVLEPVFEAEFLPCSYGFRPNRRAHDAIAETRYLASHGYEWVVEGDITACFDVISHPALMERVRNRIGDKRVLSLVKAFLKSGILSRDGAFTDTRTGDPAGRNPVAAAGQHRALGPGRAHRPGPGSCVFAGGGGCAGNWWWSTTPSPVRPRRTPWSGSAPCSRMTLRPADDVRGAGTRSGTATRGPLQGRARYPRGRARGRAYGTW